MIFKTHLLVVILMLERGIFSQGGVGVGVVVGGGGAAAVAAAPAAVVVVVVVVGW